jgi:hypothetical protein
MIKVILSKYSSVVYYSISSYLNLTSYQQQAAPGSFVLIVRIYLFKVFPAFLKGEYGSKREEKVRFSENTICFFVFTAKNRKIK